VRKSKTEPRVQVTYRVRDEWLNLLDISVQNIGLGPTQEYFSSWKSLVEEDETKVDSRLVVACIYRLAREEEISHDSVIDLSELKGSKSINEPPLISWLGASKRLGKTFMSLREVNAT
jgi:hypothetical protein